MFEDVFNFASENFVDLLHSAETEEGLWLVLVTKCARLLVKGNNIYNNVSQNTKTAAKLLSLISLISNE